MARFRFVILIAVVLYQAINIMIVGHLVEQVNQFRYLGSLISDKSEKKSRIALAKNVFNKRRELFSKRLSKQLKKSDKLSENKTEFDI